MSILVDDDVYVSDHALDRWSDRTSTDSVAPETAWEKAQRVTGPEREMGGDEARVYVAQGVLLLRRDNAIVTVVSRNEMQDRVRRDIAPILTGVDTS